MGQLFHNLVFDKAFCTQDDRKLQKKQKKHDISQWRSPPTHTRNDTGELGDLENEASMPWQHYKGPASPCCVSGKLRGFDR
uniref:Uncharacterized protein n=1 Tax=Anguilla anguilla TaxID=7936 RepID=A0A0E9XEU0_ANGAN